MAKPFIDFLARREGASDFGIYSDGVCIGHLADCEVCHVFISDDEDLAERVCDLIEGDMSLREILACVRRSFESFRADRDAETAFERDCEGAWLRAAEYCAHTQVGAI